MVNGVETKAVRLFTIYYLPFTFLTCKTLRVTHRCGCRVTRKVDFMLTA